eukprot:1884968-Prorocentrum_lima.AAC.1
MMREEWAGNFCPSIRAEMVNTIREEMAPLRDEVRELREQVRTQARRLTELEGGGALAEHTRRLEALESERAETPSGAD